VLEEIFAITDALRERLLEGVEPGNGWTSSTSSS
jgi:hypothetical protein